MLWWEVIVISLLVREVEVLSLLFLDELRLSIRSIFRKILYREYSVV